TADLGLLLGADLPAWCGVHLGAGDRTQCRRRAGRTVRISEPVPAMNALWPEQLWIVRHGQSAGNLAHEAAEAGGLSSIDIAFRDIDTPLSDLGKQQAIALGHWFGALPSSEQPEIVL